MPYPIAAFMRDIAGVECSDDAVRIRKKSRDRYAVSPLLRQMLQGKTADVVATPNSIDDVVSIARAAVRHRIPLVVRGGGTANYGQSLPLKGGILLDMLGYAGVVSLRPGMIRAKAGTIIQDMETAGQSIGWELRFHPTTKRFAAIGGFVAGGSAGPGSVVYGHLHDRGNIAAAQVVTMEDEPRILELRGRDSQLIHHTYGTTGIVTEVEMPLAPAWTWREAIVAFPVYFEAVGFGFELAKSTGIVKKLVSVQEWPTPHLIKQFRDIVPEGHAIVSTLIAEESWTEFEQLVQSAGGVVATSSLEGEGPYMAPLTEFSFGHALLQMQKTDPSRAVIEGFLRDADLVGLIGRVHAKVKHFGPMRTEFTRIGGDLIASGSPYFVYESPAQMVELVRLMQAGGAHVANSHTSNVRVVGKKEITEAHFQFKRSVDPYGLLNPGRLEIDPAADAKFDLELPTDAWSEHIG